MNEAPYFHVAILVPDLAQAMERFGRALGMTFAPPINARIPGVAGQPGAVASVAPVTYSHDGPPHLELIEAAGDGVFGAGRGYGVHHIGTWVDDPRASARSLLDLGLHVEAGLDDGTDRVALTDPADLFGVRIELCSLAIRAGWREWVGGRSDAIVEQCAADGMGVVLVEQQVRLALEVSDCACVMRRGEIAMEGASADVRRDAHLVEAHYLDRPAEAGPPPVPPARVN